MYGKALAIAAIIGVLVIPGPADAAPSVLAVSAPAGVSSASPEFMLVRGGCGLGWHRQAWRDRYGRRHVRCVPNR
jgi:hypothetical protein